MDSMKLTDLFDFSNNVQYKELIMIFKEAFCKGFTEDTLYDYIQNEVNKIGRIKLAELVRIGRITISNFRYDGIVPGQGIKIRMNVRADIDIKFLWMKWIVKWLGIGYPVWDWANKGYATTTVTGIINASINNNAFDLYLSDNDISTVMFYGEIKLIKLVIESLTVSTLTGIIIPPLTQVLLDRVVDKKLITPQVSNVLSSLIDTKNKEIGIGIVEPVNAVLARIDEYNKSGVLRYLSANFTTKGLEIKLGYDIQNLDKISKFISDFELLKLIDSHIGEIERLVTYAKSILKDDYTEGHFNIIAEALKNGKTVNDVISIIDNLPEVRINRAFESAEKNEINTEHKKLIISIADTTVYQNVLLATDTSALPFHPIEVYESDFKTCYSGDETFGDAVYKKALDFKRGNTVSVIAYPWLIDADTLWHPQPERFAQFIQKSLQKMNSNRELILMGKGMGGALLYQTILELNKLSIPVDAIFLVDACDSIGNHSNVIKPVPNNVKRVYNLRQTLPSPQNDGYNGFSVSVSNTTILTDIITNIVNTNYGSEPMAPNMGHNNIDKSENVQDYISHELIVHFYPDMRLLSFNYSECWEQLYAAPADLTFENNRMGIVFSRGTYATLRGLIQTDIVTGSKYRNVIGYLRVSMPKSPINPLTGTYRGNVQLSVNGNWAGQWELNSVNHDGSAPVVGEDGLIHKYLEFTLPDSLASLMISKPVNINISVSAANSNGVFIGEQFYLDQLHFAATDEKSEAIKTSVLAVMSRLEIEREMRTGKYDWDKYVNRQTDGYKIHNRVSNRTEYLVRWKNRYFIPARNDAYPMYLTSMWARHSSYEPGNPNAPWRQCWMEAFLL
ncbi:MAG: hypothetical protein LBH98_07125 [Chitinispirillales bacterium]|nr:hypothetical protein [Chitinispirillales bacterium]